MENPPAPKMPELGSLVVERTSEPTNHGTASGDGGGIFEWSKPSKPPKSARDCGNLHMFGTASSKFARFQATFPKHGFHMIPLGQLWPTWAQPWHIWLHLVHGKTWQARFDCYFH